MASKMFPTESQITPADDDVLLIADDSDYDKAKDLLISDLRSYLHGAPGDIGGVSPSTGVFTDLTVKERLFGNRTAVGAADYNPSAATNDFLIAFTDTSAARACIISSEDIASATTAKPRIMVIKDEGGNAGTHNITITLESGGMIDGAANKVINVNYGAVRLYLDGTDAWTI